MFCNDPVNVVGMYHARLFQKKDVMAHIIPGKRITLQREPHNTHDHNAVQVFLDDNPNDKLGYINRGIAARLAPILDRGSLYKCYIQNTYKPRGKFEIVVNLTTFPIPRLNQRPHNGNQPVTGKNASKQIEGSPTGKAFRRVSDFEKYRQKFKGKCGIYVIWNKFNKCCYVGQASNISRRWSEHYRLLSSRSHQNNMLQYDWTTLGSSYFRFDLLQETTLLELDTLERSWITRLQSFEKGYNTTPDGQQPERRPPQPPVIPVSPLVVVAPQPPVVPGPSPREVIPPRPPIFPPKDTFNELTHQIDDIYKESIGILLEKKVPATPASTPEQNISPPVPPPTNKQETHRESPEQEWQPVLLPSRPVSSAWLFLSLVFIAPILLLSFVLTLGSKDNKTTYYPPQQINGASTVSSQVSVTKQEPVEESQTYEPNFSSNRNTQQQEPHRTIEDKLPVGTDGNTTNYPQQQDIGTSVKATPPLLRIPVNTTKPIPKQSDPIVITIQNKLNRLGYDAGLADGFAGRKTTVAIEAFQRDHNIIGDGVINALLLDQINQVEKSDHSISRKQTVLNPSGGTQADAEERKVNLDACLDGHFPMSCKRELLTSKEVALADAAEKKVNFETCLDGFSLACKRGLLTSKELIQVDAAEQRVKLQR